MEDSDGVRQTDDQSRAPIGLIIAGIIVIAVAIFVGQNTDEVEVQFLFFKGTLPLFLVIVIGMVLGALLWQGILWYRRRRQRRDRRG